MQTSMKRLLYSRIRYDYYHSGRLLQRMGYFHSAGILLGYTVETTLKAGLVEVCKEPDKNKILNTSHDVIKIGSSDF